MGLSVALFIFKAGFDFEGPSDDFLKRNYGDELVSLIQADRKAVYNSDTSSVYNPCIFDRFGTLVLY
ncbi:hypothetical protein ACU8V7_23990 [Zobellia nedashkovskayae]